MSFPPLGLTVNVTDSSGAVTRWSSNAPSPENRPKNLTFGSQRMQGFATASLDLSRKVDRDYVDLHLFDDVEIVGDDGSTAWEGRIGSNPRTVAAQHSISLQCAGWMAHAKDRKFTELYVDRDLSHWGDISNGRRGVLLAASYGPVAPSVQSDAATGQPALVNEITGAWAATARGNCESRYDQRIDIGSVYYAWSKGSANVDPANVNWDWRLHGSADDLLSATTNTGNLRAAGPSTGTLTLAAGNPVAATQMLYAVAGGADNMKYNINWTCLAVYGRHGLTKQGTADATNAQGLYASDIIRHIIGNYCPKLNAAGVQSTTFAIPHLAFTDPIDPYDAFLECNKFHLWDLSVFENRTAYYTPIDLTDYDWDIRLDDPGVTTTLQGDTSEDLANGVAVSFTNLATGTTVRFTPDTHSELRDDSVENPANRAGLTVWTEYSISSPVTEDAALQIGRAALAEFNQPKAAGSITVGPYVRDRQGHWQPVWKIRSGDRVAITSSTSLSDRPRVVYEASYNHGANGVGQATLAIDSSFKTLPAVLDRISTALTAAGLT